MTIVAAACGVEGHALGCVKLGLAVGQHGLNQLEIADRLIELFALQRILQRIAQDALGHAHGHGGDVDAAFFQHFHRGLEPTALLQADQIACRHFHVIEDHVTGMGAALTHLLVVFAEADARCLGVHDER